MEIFVKTKKDKREFLRDIKSVAGDLVKEYYRKIVKVQNKKPENYFGYAWSNPKDGLNKKYLKSKEGKKEIKETNKRFKKYRKMNKKLGFDATETWNLDNSIAQFTLPRLKYFRKHLNGYPSDLSLPEWKVVLDKMIFAFENLIEDNLDIENTKKVKEGFKLFGKYFMNLWD